MKLSVIYHSESGTTKQMSDVIVSGMETVENVEAKAFSIDEIDSDWVKESKCVVVGSPIYMASITAKLKTWLEKDARSYNIAGKIGGAFATANYVHGGGELGIQTILDHMLCYGMLTFSGGGAYGKPVIHIGPVAIRENIDDYTETFKLYGERMAKKTVEVFGK